MLAIPYTSLGVIRWFHVRLVREGYRPHILIGPLYRYMRALYLDKGCNVVTKGGG